ncbi:MAG: PA0069 family radical SAM protein [Nannocystaceae bacterium]|nr:PA0069 family radical SAM protein [bacterium]
MARPSVLRQLNNPDNRFHETAVEWDVEPPPKVALQLFEDRTKSVLSKNDSPDLGFDYSVNPYRGCFHGCAYCYARPSHEYLDFGAGTDFERKLVLKRDAPALLRARFSRRSWSGALVVFSGNTDCYQPLEAVHGLTRACLQVCLEFRNPVSIITKGAVIERDIELIAALARDAYASVTVSLPFLSAEYARAVEPYVPSPARRLQVIERLAAAGIPVGVNVAPIIPGLNDAEAPAILEAAHAAGATFYGTTMVRLPRPVDAVFEARIRETLPLRADRILSQIEACRGGARNDSRFGARMRGQGARWQVIETMVRSTAKRLGLGRAPAVPDPSPFQRPDPSGQMGLF